MAAHDHRQIYGDLTRSKQRLAAAAAYLSHRRPGADGAFCTAEAGLLDTQRVLRKGVAGSGRGRL